MQEQLYKSATVILSPRSAITDGEYSETSELTGVKTFVTDTGRTHCRKSSQISLNTPDQSLR